jgi:hypothetical protein
MARAARAGSTLASSARITATPLAPASMHAPAWSAVTPPSAYTSTQPAAIAHADRSASTPRAGLVRSGKNAPRVENIGLTRTPSAPPATAARTASSVCAAMEIQARAPHTARASDTVPASRPRWTPSAPTSRASRASPLMTSEAPTARVTSRRRHPSRRRPTRGLRLSRSWTHSHPLGSAAATSRMQRTVMSSPNAGSVMRMMRGRTVPIIYSIMPAAGLDAFA